MDNVVAVYLNEAAKARAWHLILRYQWVMNASENNELDVLDGFNLMKEKEAKI